MSSIDDKLNEVLNIVPEIVDVAVVEEQTDLIVPEDKDAEVDFDKGRESL